MIWTIKACVCIRSHLRFEIGIVSLLIVLKLVYYISKFQDGFFENVLDFVIWTVVSVFISLIPVSILVISNVSEIRKKKVHPKYILVFVGYIICLVINIIIEICSYMMAVLAFLVSGHILPFICLDVILFRSYHYA